MGRPLKIAKAQAVITITATTASTNLVTTSANLNTLGVIAGMPIVLASAVGGLSANTVYWILSVVSATTFTVSATTLNANVNRTPVTLSTTTSQTVAATVAPVNAYFDNPNGPEWPATNANTYGVVGGNTSIIGNQISGNVNIGQTQVGTITATTSANSVAGVGTNFVGLDDKSLYTPAGVLIGVVDTVTDADSLTLAANAAVSYSGPFQAGVVETGFIVRQKGKQKYLVTGASGATGAVYTVNSSVSPQPVNTIVINSVNAANANVTVQSVSNKNIGLFTANSGPIATGNINLSQGNAAIATFNTAATANVAQGIPYPIVTINDL